jgi:hypothetical protein
MGIGNWGGGIVLLIAAVLWLVYLMPAWHARRQYLATERNAVRLQQTLRILAQTAELPDEVRIEMNAKSLAEAQRVAASEEARRRAIVRAHEAARQREITRKLQAQGPELQRVQAAPALTSARMRRSRLGATSLGFAGLVLAIVTLVVAPATWPLWVAGFVAVGGSVAVLGQLSAVAKARRARPAARVEVARRASRPAARTAEPERSTGAEAAAPAQEERVWTPTELPKPLYMTQPAVEREAESSAEFAARLRERVAAAAAEAKAAEAIDRATNVTRLHADVEAAATALSSHDGSRLAERIGLRASNDERSGGAANGRPAASASASEAAAPPAESRYSGMGLIDAESYESTDLDAVLRRRRVV